MWTHTWIEFSDSTIFDPTIKQFFLPSHQAACALDCLQKDCQPYLSAEFFDSSLYWLLPEKSTNRHLYLYSDCNSKIVGNALENPYHPLL